VGCPACEGRLSFGPDGDWWCDCGFRRPVPVAVVEPGAVVIHGRRFPMSLALPGRCNESNAAMAVAAADVLGVDPESSLAIMSGVQEVEGRYSTVDLGDVRARLLLAKNPAGWSELFEMLDDSIPAVVVGINARIADGRDPSWLWDVPFERLAGRLVVATGERCRDLAVRLRHAEVEHVTEPDQVRALHVPGTDDVEYAGNYTAFQALRRRLGHQGSSGAAPRATTSPTRPTGAHDTTIPRATAPLVSPRSDAASVRRAGDGVSALRVVVVHPELLGTYGDGGNALVIAQRARWRGIPAEILVAAAGDPLPESADVYCLGGGEDGPQVQAAELLRDGPLHQAVDRGAVVLAVCAGYQVAGTSFPGADGRPRAGLGLLDVETIRGTGRRAVGELLAEPIVDPDSPGPGGRPWPVALGVLSGFENHGALTRLGARVTPLATVRVGVGNGTGDGTEGAWAGRVVGTYLHGPVLARNPALADLLLAMATGEELAPLPDEEERALRAERLAASSARRIGRRPRRLLREPSTR
jgi:lipid II isoglutaminyl synthase (glutamine-hydrolysing)